MKLLIFIRKMLNVLLTSVGRRVSLVKFFKEVLKDEGIVYTADCDPTAPGLYVSDKQFLVPKVNDRDYISFLIKKCREEKIKLIIPLIDPELPVLAKAREFFLNEGIIPFVSSYETVMKCYDKFLTYEFLIESFLPTPKTFLLRDKIDTIKDNIMFPVIIKPRFGSASIGVQKCESLEDIEFYAKKIPNPILQEFLHGEEITIDVLCDFDSKPLSVVMRKRLKIRAGEVERGITIKDERLLDLTLNLIEKLKPHGVVNIQCFLTSIGFYFTEINPRFGGGYPLSYYAGANFPEMIIKMIKGEKVEPEIGKYKEDILMLRYDEGVYIDRKLILS